MINVEGMPSDPVPFYFYRSPQPEQKATNKNFLMASWLGIIEEY